MTLAHHLRARIEAEGPLSVAAYMAECLGHPVLGYYRRADPLGAAGDFTTAPEISQVFGELIGLWCAVAWESMGRPDPFVLAELGPGRGTLMADALRAARALPGFVEAARLHLVETSGPLRQAQASRLAAAHPVWCESVGDLPPGPLIVIANEFFDALPIRQFLRLEAGWAERRVDWRDGAFAFTPGPVGAAMPDEVASLGLAEAPAPGAVVEVCPEGQAIAALLGARLAREPGVALIVDYGHGRSAPGETLQAVRRHRFHAVLDEPGEADLTAHVDFQALRRAAEAAGAVAAPLTTQGAFLGRLGIEARRRRLRSGLSAEGALLLDGAIRRLIDPAEMGTLFKVLALRHPALPAPEGF